MAIPAIRFNNPFDVSLPIAGYNGAGGTVGIQGQPGFGSFPDMATGYQAGVQRLNSYITGQSSHGPKRTIKELNSVYATDPNWAAGVAAHSGIDPDATLDPNNADQMRQLQYGVLAQEMGPKNAQLIFGQNNGGASPALAFAGNSDTDGAPAVAPKPTGGALSFGGDDGDNTSSRSDNRLSIGDLFGASDATKAKMHGIGAQLMRAAAALSSGVNPSQSGQLNAAAKAAEDANQPNMQYVMGPNGQLIRINKDTGEASFATLPGGAKGNFGVVMGKDSVGNPVPLGKIDHNTGEYTPYQQTAADTQTGQYGVPVTQANPYGLPDDIEGLKDSGPAGLSLYNQLQGIKSGNIQYPTGSRVNKQMEQLRNAAAYYFPDLNANDFAARKRYQEENIKQNPGSIGGNKIALNHSYNLIGQISDKMVALNNSDNGYIPAGIQSIYNNAKNQRPANHAAANSLDTQLMPALAGETGKLYYGQGAGGQSEREKISKGLTSNGTKQDQISGLETALATLEAREADIDQQAQKAYGKDWEKYAARSDDGRKDIEKIKKNIEILKGNLNPDGTPKSIPQTNTATPASALPAGWSYLGSK